MKQKGSAKKVVMVPARLLRVGFEVFPVFGNERLGFSMDADDISRISNRVYCYQSLDELFFALVNLNIGEEGRA